MSLTAKGKLFFSGPAPSETSLVAFNSILFILLDSVQFLSLSLSFMTLMFLTVQASYFAAYLKFFFWCFLVIRLKALIFARRTIEVRCVLCASYQEERCLFVPLLVVLKLNSWMKRYTGRGLERSWAQELLSPRSWDVSPVWHIDVFTNSELPAENNFDWEC